MTASASIGLPSLKTSPSLSVNETDLPSLAYSHDSTRFGCALPWLSMKVSAEYVSASICTSEPAEEVTGSHVVGICQAHLTVPPPSPPEPALRLAATRLQGGEGADAEDGAEQRAPAQVEGGLGDARGSGHRSIDLSGTGRKSGVRSGCSRCWNPFNTFTTDLLYLNGARVAHPAHSPDASRRAGA